MLCCLTMWIHHCCDNDNGSANALTCCCIAALTCRQLVDNGCRCNCQAACCRAAPQVVEPQQGTTELRR